MGIYQNLVSIHRRKKPDLLAASDPITWMGGKARTPTTKSPLVISASELRDWLRCRVKHHWRHNCRLERREGSPALAMGSLVHTILEAWYTYESRSTSQMETIAKLAVKDTTFSELTTEDRELIEAMCVGYAFWAKTADREIGLKDCKPETWFEEWLDPERTVLVRGKIDNVFVPRDGSKGVIACQETKTQSQIRIDHVDLNLQLSVYLWAMRKKFPKFKRYIAYFTVLRKQMPGPRVKADLFHRETVERTDDEIEQWAADTRRAAIDMLDAAIYPSPMDSCSWSCDYQLPCMLRGRPDDLRYVLETEYKEKERR